MASLRLLCHAALLQILAEPPGFACVLRRAGRQTIPQILSVLLAGQQYEIPTGEVETAG
ncbi:MAG: hypothetical protein LBP78_04075 [Acidaminococcales bacterium]|jgi:hypothetical protein|nr:hypothetical protein [Acidaminococcales bacterium]